MTKIYSLREKQRGEQSEEQLEEDQTTRIMISRLKSLLVLAENGNLSGLLVVADTVCIGDVESTQKLFVSGEYILNPTLAFAALQFGANELFLGALNKPVPAQLPLI